MSQRHEVLAYLHQRPGQEVFARDIAEELGLEIKQVQMCLSNAIRDDKADGVEVSIKGQSWRWMPARGSSTKRVFEEIGPAKDGSLVIQDSSGKLYRAMEL